MHTVDHSKPTHLVAISIDGKPVQAPQRTDGAYLYALGQVPPDYTLFLEAKDGDDPAIARDATPIHLKPHEAFYSAPSKLNPGAA